MRYPLGFKTTISSCRSNQIASNSVCRWRGPISIYLFCSLIFMQSVTEIQLNKLRAHFRARFAPMIWANCAPLNVWGGGVSCVWKLSIIYTSFFWCSGAVNTEHGDILQSQKNTARQSLTAAGRERWETLKWLRWI